MDKHLHNSACKLANTRRCPPVAFGHETKIRNGVTEAQSRAFSVDLQITGNPLLNCALLLQGMGKEEITGTLVKIQAAALVNALGDVGGLLIDGGEYGAGLPVKTHVRGVVADLADGLTEMEYLDPRNVPASVGDY